MFPNGLLAVDVHLVRHALCNVIGWGRQRLLIATKGVEQKERAPEERRRFRWEWKLNTFWRLQLTNSRRYKVYGHVWATTNSQMEKHSKHKREKGWKRNKKNRKESLKERKRNWERECRMQSRPAALCTSLICRGGVSLMSQAAET